GSANPSTASGLRTGCPDSGAGRELRAVWSGIADGSGLYVAGPAALAAACAVDRPFNLASSRRTNEAGLPAPTRSPAGQPGPQVGAGWRSEGKIWVFRCCRKPLVFLNRSEGSEYDKDQAYQAYASVTKRKH